MCEVNLAGELDVATAPNLRSALGQAMASCQRATIDLADPQFCDCCGMSTLPAAARTAGAEASEIHRPPVPAPRRVCTSTVPPGPDAVNSSAVRETRVTRRRPVEPMLAQAAEAVPGPAVLRAGVRAWGRRR
ncbi:STAS domain-containing protein [Streptomyces sp. NPDC001502]|uniref:STAS domain-containing protein n=1 Tax=Streptomyces sp. NPDC001502 TaxID=3364578 RepID=UPI0036992FB0